MDIVFKRVDESTAEDAMFLIRERFPDTALDIFRKILANPMRKYDGDAGAIAYRDGRPISMQCAILRRLYIGSDPIWGIVGAMTCKSLKGCPLRVLLETIERAQHPRNNSVLSFGNTCRVETAGIGDVLGNTWLPKSYERNIWRPINLVDCGLYGFRRKILKMSVPHWKAFSTLEDLRPLGNYHGISFRRLFLEDLDFCDALMAAYLKSNKGLVCSRSSEEIAWLYGDNLKSGRVVAIGAQADNQALGYIMLRTDEYAKDWSVTDLFALRNDEQVIACLLKVACDYLRRRTPAMRFFASGFSDWIQGRLRQTFPFVQKIGHNMFSWSSTDSRVLNLLGDGGAGSRSWFFGPYDGDACM